MTAKTTFLATAPTTKQMNSDPQSPLLDRQSWPYSLNFLTKSNHTIPQDLIQGPVPWILPPSPAISL